MFCCISLFITLALTACNKDSGDGAYVLDYAFATNFTSKDATVAYDSFNKYLYNPDKKLYRQSTAEDENIAVGWVQAIYWDMTMNAYKRTKDPKYYQLINDMYEGANAQFGFDWHNSAVWDLYDDMMWWVISMARAYEITKDEKYLDISKKGFDRVWYGSETVGDIGSYDPINGGMYWDWKFGRKGKMACINYPTIIAAVTLYNITKDEEYLNKAKNIYVWASDNLFNSTTGAVADSKHDGSSDANWTMLVYNQGTCIGSGAMLYLATKDQKYLDDAVLAANYTKNTMSGDLQILPAQNDGSGLNSLTDEMGIYHAIFGQYISILIKDCGKEEFLPWIRRSINFGWKYRDKTRDLTDKNFAEEKKEDILSSYNTSGIPALMQICPPVEE